MQNTSQLYQQIIGQEGHFFESKLVIDGVTYDKSVLVEMETSVAMFSGTPEIGKAVSGQISVKMLAPSAGIPTMARMEPYVRAKTATQTSEWIQQGVFFIDTREMTKNEAGENVLSIHGFDAMLKAEQMYNGRITGNSTDIQTAGDLCVIQGKILDLAIGGETEQSDITLVAGDLQIGNCLASTIKGSFENIGAGSDRSPFFIVEIDICS